MKLKLGLCTCLKHLSLALSNGKKTFERSLEYLNQEEVIFSEIKKMASLAGGSFEDFDTIVSVNGPGRFTGMRISYTFASVYRIMSKKKVFSATVHDCLAFNVFSFSKDEKDLAVISRAFRDEFYLSYYRIEKGELKPKSKIYWLKREEITKKLNKFKGLIIGEKKDYSEIYSVANDCAEIADDKISQILPGKIIETGLYFKKKDFKPLYIKPAKYENIK